MAEQSSSIGPDQVPENGEKEVRVDEVSQVLSTLWEGMEEARNSLLSRLDQSVAEPLRRTLGIAAEAHAKLRDEARLSSFGKSDATSPDTSGEEASQIWANLCTYRNGVLTEVLEPLRDSLLSVNTGNKVEAEWSTFVGDLTRLVASMPPEASRLEPLDLYLPREGDGFFTRAGKSAVRIRRHLGSWAWNTQELGRRLTRRPLKPRPDRIQTVPIQEVVRVWFEGSVAGSLEPIREELHQHFSIPLADLERGVAGWIRDWPVAEARFDRGTAYLPADLLTLLSDHFHKMCGEDQLEVSPEAAAPDAGEDPPAAPPSSPSEISAALQECLVSGREHATAEAILADSGQSLEEVWSALLTFVTASGTFMRSLPPPRLSEKARRAKERQEARVESWVKWHRGIPTRLVLGIQILRLRSAITSAREGLVKGIAEGVVIPLFEAWTESSRILHDLGARGNTASSKALEAQDPEAFAKELTSIKEEGLAVLESALLSSLSPDELEKDIHDLADEISTGLARYLLELPDSLAVQGIQKEVRAVDPCVAQKEIRLREIAQQVLDILRLEGFRHTPTPILEALAASGEAATALPEVMTFNLEAASEELTQLSSGTEETKDPAARLEEAASLAREGLTRTEEGVNRLLSALPDAWSAFTGSADDLLGGAYLEVHARIFSEGGVQEQMVGLEARVTYSLRMAMTRFRSSWKRWDAEFQRTSRKVGVRALRMIRLGKTVVGAKPAGKDEGDRALAVFQKAPELLSGLPLAYRRLFSFQPLTDESLLTGRTDELAWVQRRLNSWESGLGTPSILTGPVGAGHTSFFNVLSKSLFSSLKVHRVELTERTLRPEVVASMVAEEFGYASQDPWDFPRLIRFLSQTSSRKTRRVVLIERLEHLFLRTPGGTDALEDFLSFQVQTSDSVFWLSSMAGAAWKLMAKTEPRGASLVQTHPLSTPTRKDMEELILARHKRSGLPLEYRTPKDLNPLVRRRLRLSANEQARQVLLQTEFFDRLFRLSQGSIPLGILHWLRSIDFRSAEGRVWVTPPSEIRYAFMEDLDLDLDFALKAFLEHGSLSLEEYGEVFAASEDDSVQTFEALRSRLLLETTRMRGDLTPSSTRKVEEGERYRIPVLLSQVVARRLKDRNILH